MQYIYGRKSRPLSKNPGRHPNCVIQVEKQAGTSLTVSMIALSSGDKFEKQLVPGLLAKATRRITISHPALITQSVISLNSSITTRVNNFSEFAEKLTHLAFDECDMKSEYEEMNKPQAT